MEKTYEHPAERAIREAESTFIAQRNAQLNRGAVEWEVSLEELAVLEADSLP